MEKKSKSQKAPHLKLSFPVGKEKIAAIQRCLSKGQLTITISKVELLKGGRAKNGYIYD